MLRQYTFIGILTLLLTGLQVWSGHITRIEDMPRPEVDPVVRNQMLGVMGPVKSGMVLGEQNTLLDMKTLNGLSSFFQNDGLNNLMVASRQPASVGSANEISASIPKNSAAPAETLSGAPEAKVWQRVSHAPLVIEPIREPLRGTVDGNRSGH